MREVSLISYLPLFIQEYNEIRKIMTAENPEFEMLWDWNELIRDNLFIMTAGEIGIKRYEQMLGIFPLPEDTLESRKARILIRINEQLPYTLKRLRNLLDAIAGEGNYNILLDADTYNLTIRLAVFSNSIADSIIAMLKSVVPANLIFIISNDTVQLTELFYRGAMLQALTHNLSVGVDLTFDFDDAEASGKYYSSIATLHTSNHKLKGSVDLSDTLDINKSGQLYAPMNSVKTESITQKISISI